MFGCPFCHINEDNILDRDDLCYAIWDQYPVSPGHVLIIPYRHIASYFDMIEPEKISLFQLIDTCKKIVDKEYSPDGYNIGINIGEPAGQTVMHCHVHLIPRYSGDLKDPRGGVRGVIPEKRIYTNK